MSTSILVVAAHPDDEVLGCGGTMARHATAGDSVHVLFLADGVTARRGPKDVPAEVERRAAAAARAAETLEAYVRNARLPGRLRCCTQVARESSS